uniref:Uncharacterized protein n=1 Tax=Kalanchoe fedtschenkoi TaxID=63787 RepID=A0A7N0U8X4_KALFE
MAHLLSNGNNNHHHHPRRRDLDQVITSLKKGARLLKYGRQGKPKFYPFRSSSDESTLIWVSNSGERSSTLSAVSRIVPGQRSICKDKLEVETWIAGLQEIIVFS